MSWDKNGLRLKESNDLSTDESRAISKIRYKEYLDSEGNVKTKHIDVEFHSKLTALDALAKHLGMYTIKQEHTHKFGAIQVPAHASPHDWMSIVKQEIEHTTNGHKDS